MRKLLALSLLGLAACSSPDMTTTPEPVPTPVPGQGAIETTVEKLGAYDFSINENSGMAYSYKKDRLYTIQDSGNASEVYVTTKEGKLLGKYKLSVGNEDWEALSYGPCGDKFCIFVGDIGDNEDDRSSVSIYAFEEPEAVSGSITPKEIKFTYVDGAINAEGMAVNAATKQLFIMSKNYDEKPHKFYRLEGPKATLLGTVPITMAIGDLAISPDGKKVAYMEASAGKIWIENTPGKLELITVPFLGQHESLTWISETEILYSSEGTKDIYKITLGAPKVEPSPPPTSAKWWVPVPGSKFQIMDEDDGDYVKQLKPGTQIVEIEAVKSDYSVLKKQIDALHAKGVKVICYHSLSVENWRADMKQFPSKCIGKKMDGWDEKWTDTRVSTCEAAHKFWDKRFDQFAKAGCDAVEEDNLVDPKDNATGFPLTAAESEELTKRRADYAHKLGMAHIYKNNPSVSALVSKHSDGIMIEGAKRWNERAPYAPWIKAGKFVGSIEYRSQDCSPWIGAVVQYHPSGDYFDGKGFKSCD